MLIGLSFFIAFPCLIIWALLLFFLSEDAEKLRTHTLSEAGDMDSLQKMADISDSEDLKDDSSEEWNGLREYGVLFWEVRL